MPMDMSGDKSALVQTMAGMAGAGKQQTIVSTNVVQVRWHHIASPGVNELNDKPKFTINFFIFHHMVHVYMLLYIYIYAKAWRA